MSSPRADAPAEENNSVRRYAQAVFVERSREVSIRCKGGAIAASLDIRVEAFDARMKGVKRVAELVFETQWEGQLARSGVKIFIVTFCGTDSMLSLEKGGKQEGSK